MTPDPDVLASILLKAIGSMLGAFLALLFKWPKTREDAWRRALFSFVSGVVLGKVTTMILQAYFNVDDTAETIVAVSTITAFLSWSSAGVLLKFVDRWGTAKE